MSDYHSSVATYFDHVACSFDQRYWDNPILQRMRQVFREEAKRLPWRSALEIGCGTGIDLVHFATIFPERTFLGFDLSPEMVARARDRIRASGKKNVRVDLGGVEVASGPTALEQHDLCYVFFGALNTTRSLDRAADQLYDALAPGGHLVLTFVNRWYLAEMLICMIRGRWSSAFARHRSQWPGYTPERPLRSWCPGPRAVHRAFGGRGELVRRRGLCIAYPAWYRQRLAAKLGRLAEPLWHLDVAWSRTPAWQLGEYALYVYRKHSGADH
jgi:SAM-dependent methyltransferase